MRSDNAAFDKKEGDSTITTITLATTTINSSLLALNVTGRGGMQALQYLTFPTSVSRIPLPW